jgi:hypothetical protein
MKEPWELSWDATEAVGNRYICQSRKGNENAAEKCDIQPLIAMFVEQGIFEATGASVAPDKLLTDLATIV